VKAYTIATPEYAELARITAACCAWATGLEVVVLTDVADPFEAKLQIDDEQYLFFDADLLLRRQWEVPRVPLGTFAAAPLECGDRGRKAIREQHKLPAQMMSTGLFIADRSHAPVMTRALELMRANPGVSSAQEETWLNVALQETGTPVLLLPQTVNSQLHKSVREVGMHFCFERGAEAKLAAVRFNLERYAPDELRDYLRTRGVAPLFPLAMMGRSRRAFGANGRSTATTPVRGPQLRTKGDDRLAKVVRPHGPAAPVDKPVKVPKLVDKNVNK
jgi:hypothetical protein